MSRPAFWSGAPWVALLITAAVAVRLHEHVATVLAVVKPVLTVSVLGMVLLVAKSPPGVLRGVIHDRAARLMAAYFVWVVATIPFSLWPGLSVETVQGLLPGLLLLTAVLFCAPEQRTLQRMQVGFVVLVGVLALYFRVGGSSYMGRLDLAGSYDSNDTAALMAIAFALAAGLLARAGTGRARVVAGVAVVVLILGIVGSGSRGSTLGLLAGALVFALGLRGGRRFVVIGCMIAGGAVVWATATPVFRARMLSLTELQSDYNATEETGRVAVWKRGVGYVVDNPVMGVGAGSFPVAEGGVLADRNRTGKWSAAHNAYVQAFAELGLVGGGIFVAMLVVAIRRSLRLWRGVRLPDGSWMRRPEFLAALASYMVAAIFLSHAYFHPLFALLGMIALADRTAELSLRGAGAPALPAAPLRVRGQRGGLARLRPSPPAASHVR